MNDCKTPDWEGGMIQGKHKFGLDNICIFCGEQNDLVPVDEDWIVAVMNGGGSWSEWRAGGVYPRLEEEYQGFWSNDCCHRIVLYPKLKAVEKAKYCLNHVEWVYGAKAEHYVPRVHGNYFVKLPKACLSPDQPRSPRIDEKTKA